MLRTIFMIGVFALLGLFALKLVFGIFGVLLGLFFALLMLALKIALIGLVVYVVIRIFSPDTARRMRERWSGNAGDI
jgi:hypothetical protein